MADNHFNPNSNRVEVQLQCSCYGAVDNSKDVPYYTQLGYGPTLNYLRRVMEERSQFTGSALRFEKVNPTNREGISREGCPVPKWIIRRSGKSEKILILVTHRRGHHCETTWFIVGIVCWDALKPAVANDYFDYLRYTLPRYGFETKRKCGVNSSKTCACQGFNSNAGGASYSFGCSWSMYGNGCKYRRASGSVRKFRLKQKAYERELDNRLQRLADAIGPVYRKLAPDAFYNQTVFDSMASQCRIGLSSLTPRPFSGVTACMDYCTHAHKDHNNMNNGCTAVVSLTRGSLSNPDDEQFHVLPFYVLDGFDEYGSSTNQLNKVYQGSIEILNNYPRIVRCQPQLKRSVEKEHSIDVSVNHTINRENIENCGQHSDSPPKYILKVNKPIILDQKQYQSAQPNYQSNVNSLTYHQNQISLPPINSWFRVPINTSIPMSRNLSTKAVYIPKMINEMNNPTIESSYDFSQTMSMKEQQNTHQFRRPDEHSKTKYWSDSKEVFRDRGIGGVAIALSHGSLFFEVAKREVHATTALKYPDRTNPSRISLVFYQHKNLNRAQHGYTKKDILSDYDNFPIPNQFYDLN